MAKDEPLTFFQTKSDLPATVRMLADATLGSVRERFERTMPEVYVIAFEKITSDANQERPDAIRFYKASGFKATHEGMKLKL